MCDPVSASIAVLGGSAISAYGQAEAGDYNAALAEQNAKVAGIQAQDALTRGTAEESRYRGQVSKLMGRQRAAIGSSGIEASGSALDILADTARTGELDALTIRNNAAREAWGYRVQAVNSRAQGKIDKFSSRVGALGTLLTGGAQAYGIYNSGG